MRFVDKVCIVTGGGSGIGRGACMRFAQEGGKVLVLDISEPHGKETVEEITRKKGEALFARCDVGNPEDIKAAIRIVVDKWKQIDVVVNDAAMMTFKPILELPDE